MAVSTKKRTTQLNHPKHHRAFGIQKWLLSKGYCTGTKKYTVDDTKYIALLEEFCEANGFIKPEKKKGRVLIMESFTSNRFDKFCQFATKKFINNLNP